MNRFFLKRIQRLTLSGIFAFIVAGAVVLSAYRDLRIEIAGLLVHPYLLGIFLLFIFAAVPRLKFFPGKLVFAMALFMGLYLLSIRDFEETLKEGFKIAGFFITVITAALLIRSEKDFNLGVLGFNLGICYLALHVFLDLGQAYEASWQNPLDEIANKNAFSLYALPAMLLAGYVLIHSKPPVIFRSVLLFSMAVTGASIFMGGNRSGWLGVGLIVALLSWQGRFFRKILFAGAFGLLAYFLIQRFGTTEVFQYKVEQTLEGYQSDTIRRELFMNSLRIGLENPLLGIGPEKLRIELARQVKLVDEPLIDPHNVLAHLIGGSGFLVFFALLYLGYILWQKPRLLRIYPREAIQLRSAHQLLRMLIILWLIRGLFSREILYNPGFAFGFGFAIGFYLFHYRTLKMQLKSIQQSGHAFQI